MHEPGELRPDHGPDHARRPDRRGQRCAQLRRARAPLRRSRPGWRTACARSSSSGCCASSGCGRSSAGRSSRPTRRSPRSIRPTRLPDRADDAADLRRLDAGFLALLPRLGVRRAADRPAEPDGRSATCRRCWPAWPPIDTHGADSLYREHVPEPALLEAGSGVRRRRLRQRAHSTARDEAARRTPEALRAAFTLTGDELTRHRRPRSASTPTRRSRSRTISAIYRRGWLARKLQLSVRELLLLIRLQRHRPVRRARSGRARRSLGLLDLVDALRAARAEARAGALSDLEPGPQRQVRARRRGRSPSSRARLRADFAAIESEFAHRRRPDGEIARARMALVYGNGRDRLLLRPARQHARHVDVPYSAPAADARAADPRRRAGPHRLRRLPQAALATPVLMTTDTRDALKPCRHDATRSRRRSTTCTRENQARSRRRSSPATRSCSRSTTPTSPRPTRRRRSGRRCSRASCPSCKRRRKRAAGARRRSARRPRPTPAFAAGAPRRRRRCCTRPPTRPLARTRRPGRRRAAWPRRASSSSATPRPASRIDDERRRRRARLRARPARTPCRPTPATAISGIWSGYIEAPESGFYNLRVEADAGATVTLTLDGDAPSRSTQNGSHVDATPRRSSCAPGRCTPIDADGREGARTRSRVRWETAGRGWEVIPRATSTRRPCVDHLLQAYIAVPQGRLAGERRSSSRASEARAPRRRTPTTRSAARAGSTPCRSPARRTPPTAHALLTAA